MHDSRVEDGRWEVLHAWSALGGGGATGAQGLGEEVLVVVVGVTALWEEPKPQGVPPQRFPGPACSYPAATARVEHAVHQTAVHRRAVQQVVPHGKPAVHRLLALSTRRLSRLSTRGSCRCCCCTGLSMKGFDWFNIIALQTDPPPGNRSNGWSCDLSALSQDVASAVVT